MITTAFPEIAIKAQMAADIGLDIAELVKPLCGSEVKEIRVVFTACVSGTHDDVVAVIKPGVEEFTVWGL